MMKILMPVTCYCHMGIYGKVLCVDTWVRTLGSHSLGRAWEEELEQGEGGGPSKPNTVASSSVFLPLNTQQEGSKRATLFASI